MTPSRLGVWALVAACVLLRLTPPWEINHDCGWLLFAASRFLAGDALYSELIEINPPLIIYLNVPPAALASFTGLSVGAALNLWVASLLGLSLFLTSRIVRVGDFVRLMNPIALAAVAFVLVVPVGRDFGQREHLMMILTLPYFAVVGQRVAGGDVRSGQALGAGLLAAVGFSLKPYFLLAPVLVRIGTALWQRKLFDTRRSENEGLVLGVVVYAAHFFVVPFQSDFAANLELTLEVYGSFKVSFVELLSKPWTIEALVVIVVLSVAAIFAGSIRTSIWVLILAQLGFLGSAFWQGKGWTYHLFPALACGYLGFVVLVFGAGARWLRGVFVVVCLCYVALPIGQHWLQREPELAFADAFTGIPPELDAVRELRPGDTLLVVDTDIHTFFAWMVDHEIGWGSRYACLWPLPGGSSERREDLRRIVLEDIVKHKPNLVFVRKGRPSFIDDEFEISDWLRADWTGYEEQESTLNFRTWRRR